MIKLLLVAALSLSTCSQDRANRIDALFDQVEELKREVSVTKREIENLKRNLPESVSVDMKTRDNMRTVEYVLATYAIDNQGKYPENLSMLMTYWKTIEKDIKKPIRNPLTELSGVGAAIFSGVAEPNCEAGGVYYLPVKTKTYLAGKTVANYAVTGCSYSKGALLNEEGLTRILTDS